ncbi:Lrp/AsnC family transcriptional regulator [Methylovirgula sp. 4M-Z18]|nr:Lrp/AsnC family transcriptional regulator [Methylovirgula sp. 4M-Z18]
MLDTTDKRILRALQADATLSLEALAELTHISRNACWRRVQALEAAGTIRRRVALLDPKALNLGLVVLIHIRANQHNAAWTEQFRKAVLGLPEILAAYRTAGDIDYILRARVPDVAGYDALYKKLIATVELSDVSAHFVMEEMKDTWELPLG